ncbi:MAG: hypothetical protein AAF961_09560, partial [Planctomycetota bacterium]
MSRFSFYALLTLGSTICADQSLSVGEDGASSADVIWIEGEDAVGKNVSHHAWYDGVKKESLSENEWLSHFDDGREGFAQYAFTVPKGDRFIFWLRANPVASRLSYRLDDAEAWAPIDFDQDRRGTINIAQDDKPDLRFIAWIKVGEFTLAKGAHTIEFRFHSGPQNHGGIDCFLFTRVPFVPSGTSKPAERGGAATPDEWFPIIMDVDPLAADSVIDISRLVEAPAGKQGFLKRDGGSLRFEKA